MPDEHQPAVTPAPRSVAPTARQVLESWLLSRTAPARNTSGEPHKVSREVVVTQQVVYLTGKRVQNDASGSTAAEHVEQKVASRKSRWGPQSRGC